MIPCKSYFLINLDEIIDEIKEVEMNSKYSIHEEYFSFEIENCLLLFIDLEKNQDIWNPKSNFIDYSNEENDIKIGALCSLWNSGNPIKTLPPILEWDQKNKYFSIVDGFHRARLISNAFSRDDAEGEMIFLFKRESYNSLPHEIKERVQMVS